MKKQIVIKVQMNCDKCRSKAMQLAASVDGVDSIKVDGEDKNQLVVVGEGVDPVILTRILRKNIGHSDIVKVGEMKKGDEEKKSEEPKIEPIAWCHYTPARTVVVQDMAYGSGGCSIM
ncbi:heavy metal-associated isoprenylated plant protein 47 [Elaeis guineensis]|uniref:Heavy metal-associated isoprenylated plant protein 47 n=1 Tax=Elaeis guineensis var. tenera TaxID=51953 RepID=A0A6I9RTD3_ELAGV|nr:heavy metal-associated isoprenylated plant protein 47 [Elaeis guineensis]